MIDGPLQYDAAVMADVAKSKAPNSPVAGRATVFIFPPASNTGNTTYKAVQRSADLISIGHNAWQGMRKPVNHLVAANWLTTSSTPSLISLLSLPNSSSICPVCRMSYPATLLLIKPENNVFRFLYLFFPLAYSELSPG